MQWKVILWNYWVGYKFNSKHLLIQVITSSCLLPCFCLCFKIQFPLCQNDHETLINRGADYSNVPTHIDVNTKLYACSEIYIWHIYMVDRCNICQLTWFSALTQHWHVKIKRGVANWFHVGIPLLISSTGCCYTVRKEAELTWRREEK